MPVTVGHLPDELLIEVFEKVWPPPRVQALPLPLSIRHVVPLAYEQEKANFRHNLPFGENVARSFDPSTLLPSLPPILPRRNEIPLPRHCPPQRN